MKKFFFFLIFLAGVQNSFGQVDAVVSGRVIDRSTRKPLAFATVTINSSPGGKLISGTVTDDEGRFSIVSVPQGEFLVNCSFVGYGSVSKNLLVGRLNKSFDLGRIEMDPRESELGEVIISGDRNLVSAGIDRKSFDVTGNISQAGGSVLDVMRNLPGITIDQEGKLELRGSDKVSVLIDGKQSSLTGYGNQKGLESIPASNIERIEIINNPSAKYDATGMAGVINIIYRKESQAGFNGSAGLSAGLGQLSERKPDLPTELGSYNFNHKMIPSLDLNFRKNKLNLFFQSQILNQRKLPNNEFTTRIYDNGKKTISQVPENRKQTQYIVKGGADFNFNDHNSITFSMVYDYESHHDTAQVPYIDMVTNERYRYWSWLEYEITGFMNYSLAYKHKFSEPGHEFSANIQYTKGWEDESYHLNDSSEIRISDDFTHILATEHTSSLTADYVRPLSTGRLEAGAKFQSRKIPVTYDVEMGEQSVIYPGLGEWSDWGEDIYAGYLNWVFEGKKISIEAGLRAEYVSVFYDLDPVNIYYPENDEYDYFNLYPNTRLTLKFSNNHSLSGFFNRRIDRPGEPELRVFPKYDDPELLKVGNPYLRPQFTTTFELAYKRLWDKGSLSLAAYYKKIDDPYTRIYSIDSASMDYDIVNKIYTNVGSGTNAGAEVILNKTITGFWKLSGSMNWYINRIKAYTGNLLFPYERPFSIQETNDISADFKINNQITFWKNSQFQLAILYYTPKNIPQGRQAARSSVDFGFKKSILDGKGEITYSFTDVFNDFGIRQDITGDGFTAIYENYYETQVMTLGFKYKF